MKLFYPTPASYLCLEHEAMNICGIMANRFSSLLTTMSHNTNTVTSVVLVCCILHNISRIIWRVYQGVTDNEDENHRLVPGQW